MTNDEEKTHPIDGQSLPRDGDGPVEHPRLSKGKENESPQPIDEESNHSRCSHDTIEPAPDLRDDFQESKSTTSSSGGQVPETVSRSQRRGLLARFAVIPEVKNPYLYKNNTKWLLTFLVAIAGAAAPVGSAIFLPALSQLSIDLDTTPKIANLSVALYMLSMSICPLWWSSFSETLGRRSIYLVSFAFFTLWNVISALSTSIGMLIVMRILGGGAAASVQAVGAGTIADIWESRERGRAMGIFYLGPLLGPLLAPIIGGALSQAWGWRSTQWFQVIYGGLIFIIILFGLPETLAIKESVQEEVPSEDKMVARPELTRTSTRQSVQMKTKKGVKIFKRCIIDPLSVLGFLRFPAVFVTVCLASVTFGALYILNISIQQTFSGSPYNFSPTIVGLLYIPNSVGYFIGSIGGGPWTDYIMQREARAAGRYDERGKLIYHPEDRLRENAWLAAVIFPGALIWYGWTAEKETFWVAPVISGFFFGLGSMIIFGAATTMLTEFLPQRSSSGVAVNNFVRNIFSCVGGVIANPIIDAIGNGWLFTGLGIICWITAFTVIWAMMKFAPRWRKSMDRQMG